MSDNAKMLLRYGVTAVVAFGVGKGWFSQLAGDAIINAVIEISAVILAFIPPVYAALKIDNSPAS